jgi:hypothetical protein
MDSNTEESWNSSFMFLNGDRPSTSDHSEAEVLAREHKELEGWIALFSEKHDSQHYGR